MTSVDDTFESDGGAAALTSDDLVQSELVALHHNDTFAAVLRLNRPAVLNAMSWDMIGALETALRTADDDPRVRAVLITGNGRGFSAGGDLKAYLELQRDPERFPRFVDDLMRTFASIKLMRKPAVALVNGVTMAGGLELLLACDFAYVAASAQIGDGHLNYGQMGGGGVLSMLPRTINPGLARELLFSGALLSADEAVAHGLANRVVADTELLQAGLAFARSTAEKSPAAVANAKYVMNAGLADGNGLDEAIRLERERNVTYCLTHPDAQEGLLAFAAKRRPEFLTQANVDTVDRARE